MQRGQLDTRIAFLAVSRERSFTRPLRSSAFHSRRSVTRSESSKSASEFGY